MVPSSHTRIKAFCRIIHNAGISVNIRTQFGSDINAACGQLAGAYRDDQKQGERTMSAIQEQSFEWLLCPVCKSKTRLKIRKDTILDNFPLFCPKCKSEMLICVKQFHISIIKEPDAQTQSR